MTYDTAGRAAARILTRGSLREQDPEEPVGARSRIVAFWDAGSVGAVYVLHPRGPAEVAGEVMVLARRPDGPWSEYPFSSGGEHDGVEELIRGRDGCWGGLHTQVFEHATLWHSVAGRHARIQLLFGFACRHVAAVQVGTDAGLEFTVPVDDGTGAFLVGALDPAWIRIAPIDGDGRVLQDATGADATVTFEFDIDGDDVADEPTED